MEFVQKTILSHLEKLKKSGFLVVLYALLSEALCIGAFVFLGLLTLEMLLPTFIVARLSLTKFFFALFTLSFGLIFLARYLELSFPFRINKKSPLVWTGTAWLSGIILLSLYKFPLLSLPFIALGLLASVYFFLHIFFEEKNPE